jgi:hypothetical protein
MIKDIHEVGKELALDIVTLNKKIDTKAQMHSDRVRAIDQWMQKQLTKMHKIMKQYNQVSHQVRRIENAFNTIERQAAFEEAPHKAGGAGRSKSRKGSVSKVVIREGEVMVDRGSIQRAKSNSCSLRRRSTSA